MYADPKSSGAAPSTALAVVASAPGSERTVELRATLEVVSAADAADWRMEHLLRFLLGLSETDGTAPRYRDGFNLAVVEFLADLPAGCLSHQGDLRDIALRFLPTFELSEDSMMIRDGELSITGYLRERVRQLAKKKKKEDSNFHCRANRPNQLSWFALAHELRLERDQVSDPALLDIINQEGPYAVPMTPWLGEEGLSKKHYGPRRDQVWPFVVAWKESGRPPPCKEGRPGSIDWRRLEQGLDKDAPAGPTLANSATWKRAVRKLFGEPPAPEGAISARKLDWDTLAAKGEEAIRLTKAGQATLEKSVSKMTNLLIRVRRTLGHGEDGSAPVGNAFDGSMDDLAKRVMGIVDDAELVGNVKVNFGNIRLQLNDWSVLAARFRDADDLPPRIEDCLEFLCRRRGCSVMDVHRGTGIPYDDLLSWRNGLRPFNPNRVDDARAIANFFGVKEDDLVGKLRDTGRRRGRGGPPIPAGFEDVDARVWQFIEPVGDPETLRAKVEHIDGHVLHQPRLASAFRRASIEMWQATGTTRQDGRDGTVAAELDKLRKFRTAIDTGGQVRGKPVDDVTAGIFENDVGMSLRWLAVDPVHGGAGVEADALSMAVLWNPQNVVTNVLWRAHRLQDVEYKGQRRGVVATVKEQQLLYGVAQLMRDPTGWMRQNPKVFKDVAPIDVRLPTYEHIKDNKGRPLQCVTEDTDLTVLSEDMARSIRSGDVAEISRRCEVRCRQFAVAIEEIMDRTRDSWVPVFDMLKEDRPMDGFWQCVYAGRDRYADPRTQPIWYQQDFRAQLLMELYGIVPLRSFTMGSLQSIGRRDGHIKIDGETISLVIEPDLFKNRRTKKRFGPPAKRRPFEREIPNVNGIHDMIREWCLNILPHNRKRGGVHDNPWMWPTGRGNAMIGGTMNDVVSNYTRARFVHNPYDDASTGIPGVMFFGPQAIRSLAATHKIKEHPGTLGRAEAADLLYTSIDMIEDDYARIETAIEQARFDEEILRSAGAGAARAKAAR